MRRTLLEVEGYRVCWVASGRDALVALTEAAPDLILAAEPLLRLTGGKLVERLLEHGAPVVVMDSFDAETPSCPASAVSPNCRTSRTSSPSSPISSREKAYGRRGGPHCSRTINGR